MPTCSAKGCFNSSKKGSSMCYFPRNLDRKKKWLDNCYKLGGMHDDWKPLESSALCEVRNCSFYKYKVQMRNIFMP